MDRARLTYLFRRYVDNTCTEAEKSEFFTLIHDGKYEAPVKDLMDELWQEVGPRILSEVQSDHILKSILQDSHPSTPVRRLYIPWGRIAASLLLLVLFSGLAYYYYNQSIPGTGQLSNVSEPNFISLPDGSTVVLNAGSRLDYPREFTGNAREVSLIGEGYFDIVHDPANPFIVRTGKLTTTVLGTAFNIRAYPDQSDITVTVTRGKVKVSDDKKVLGIINPDQQITFNRDQQVAEQKVVNSHNITAWIEKDIFFDDLTIAQAVAQLEKRFGISVELQNEKISTCRFTATFVKGEDVEQILRILCDFNNAKLLKMEEGIFKIEGGECPV